MDPQTAYLQWHDSLKNLREYIVSKYREKGHLLVLLTGLSWGKTRTSEHVANMLQLPITTNLQPAWRRYRSGLYVYVPSSHDETAENICKKLHDEEFNVQQSIIIVTHNGRMPDAGYDIVVGQ